MKKLLIAIMISMVMVLSFSVLAFGENISGMGGGNKKAMTQETYVEYRIVLKYLYDINQTDMIKPYIMRLYDDYGYSVDIISDAFGLDYSFVYDTVAYYTEGRDPNKVDTAYEEWKNMTNYVPPVQESKPDDSNPATGENQPDTAGTGGTTTAPSNNTSSNTNNLLPSDLSSQGIFDPNWLYSPVSVPTETSNPVSTPTPNATPDPTANNAAEVAEALAKNDIIRDIVSARLIGEENALKANLAKLEKDGMTFEQLVTLSEFGATGLDSLLRSYGKDFSLLNDILSESFIESFVSDPTPTVSAPQNHQALPTPSTVLVNGENVSFDAYNINGNNYFKLRDIAYILTGSQKQFEVTWDGSKNLISLISGSPYTANGSEMAARGYNNKTAVTTGAKVIIDGIEVNFTAYNIDGNNYFKLRDLGATFDFSIGWNGETSTITVDTSNSYTQ